MPKNKLSKLELRILSSKKWEFGYERRMTYQRIRGFNYANHYHFPKVFKVDLTYEIFRIKDGIVSLYREVEENKIALQKIQGTLSNKKSVNLIKKLSKTIVLSFKKFRDFNHGLPTDYSEYSLKELCRQYEKIIEIDSLVSFANRLTFTQFEEVLTASIEILLLENAKEVTSVLSCPDVITPVDQYDVDISKVAILSKEKQVNATARLYKKYAHFGMFDFNYPVLDVGYHVNKISKINIKTVEAFCTEIKQKYIVNKKRSEKVLQKYKSQQHIYVLCELYHTIANMKEWKNYYREENSYKLRFLMEEIGRRFSISLTELGMMSFEDIENLLSEKVVPNIKLLQERFRNSAFVFFGNSLSVVTELDDLKNIDKVLETKEPLEIKGLIVFSGKVRGVVKVVVSDNDFRKINKGDILVTSTTRPSFLPIMSLACAFVTNEGGMLSHAAIVAREMKKPCIVGTKIATKVLKDGDLVEVDAEKGVVTIIKRA